MMNQPSPFWHFQPIADGLQKFVPKGFFYYVVAYLVISFLLFVFYIPGNDFDSMTSYITRIKLEEFGPLEKTGTLEIQYLFPKFFDYLHAPFLKFGYFITLPNFLLFLSLLFILLKVAVPQAYLWILLFVFSAQPLLVGMTSLKNDMTLGIFAVIAWYFIFYFRNKTWFITVVTLSLAALVGTKVHGVLLITLLMFPFIYQLWKERRFNQKAILLWFLFTPLFTIVSSVSVYLANIQKYGSIMPKLDYLGSSEVAFFKNIYTFTLTTFLQTFDIPVYFSDAYFKTNLLQLGKNLVLGAKNADYGIIRPAANLNAFGVVLLIVLALDIYVILKPKFSLATKTLAAIALVYCLGLLTQFTYSNWINRYFLPTYILSILPAAEALTYLSDSYRWLKSTWFKSLLILYAILVSIHCLLFTAEKNLVTVKGIDLNTGGTFEVASVWPHFTDRDSLYFHLWSGYRQINTYIRDNISLSDSFLFINNATGNDPPFLYPFIKDRQAANTYVFNSRYGGTYEYLLGDYEFIMVYRGEINDPRYQEDFNYNKGEMIIYRLINTKSDL